MTKRFPRLFVSLICTVCIFSSSLASGLLYSTFLGGSSTNSNGDAGNGIAIDSFGNAYIIGNVGSTDFPVTSNAFQTVDPNTTGGITVFLTKLRTIPLVAIGDWEIYGISWNTQDRDARKPQE